MRKSDSLAPESPISHLIGQHFLLYSLFLDPPKNIWRRRIRHIGKDKKITRVQTCYRAKNRGIYGTKGIPNVSRAGHRNPNARDVTLFEKSVKKKHALSATGKHFLAWLHIVSKQSYKDRRDDGESLWCPQSETYKLSKSKALTCNLNYWFKKK